MRGGPLAIVRHAQADLIEKSWPDKLLYGSILLLVTSILGVLHGLVLSIGVTIGKDVPAVLTAMPGGMVTFLSAVAAVLAFLAMKRLSTTLGIAGAVAGVLAVALFGLGSLLSLLALGFLLWARAEGEDRIPEAERLDPEEWPDKSLGASLVLLLAGLLGVAWGGAMMAGTVTYAMDPAIVGGLEVAAGLFALAAAWGLYHQRWKWIGVAAGVACVATFAGYVLGPILGLAGIGLVLKASAEGEFG